MGSTGGTPSYEWCKEPTAAVHEEDCFVDTDTEDDDGAVDPGVRQVTIRSEHQRSGTQQSRRRHPRSLCGSQAALEKKCRQIPS